MKYRPPLVPLNHENCKELSSEDMNRLLSDHELYYESKRCEAREYNDRKLKEELEVSLANNTSHIQASLDNKAGELQTQIDGEREIIVGHGFSIDGLKRDYINFNDKLNSLDANYGHLSRDFNRVTVKVDNISSDVDQIKRDVNQIKQTLVHIHEALVRLGGAPSDDASNAS